MTSPVELVRAFYAAVAAGDVPGVVGLLHPEPRLDRGGGISLLQRHLDDAGGCRRKFARAADARLGRLHRRSE